MYDWIIGPQRFRGVGDQAQIPEVLQYIESNSCAIVLAVPFLMIIEDSNYSSCTSDA